MYILKRNELALYAEIFTKVTLLLCGHLYLVHSEHGIFPTSILSQLAKWKTALRVNRKYEQVQQVIIWHVKH